MCLAGLLSLSGIESIAISRSGLTCFFWTPVRHTIRLAGRRTQSDWDHRFLLSCWRHACQDLDPRLRRLTRREGWIDSAGTHVFVLDQDERAPRCYSQYWHSNNSPSHISSPRAPAWSRRRPCLRFTKAAVEAVGSRPWSISGEHVVSLPDAICPFLQPHDRGRVPLPNGRSGRSARQDEAAGCTRRG